MGMINESEFKKYIEGDVYSSWAEKTWQRLEEIKNPLGNILCFKTYAEEQAFAKAIGKKYKSFKETYEALKNKKGFKSDYEVYRASNLSKDYFWKLMNRINSIRERDPIWALAIGMGLNMKETEELFDSCGLSLKGMFKGSEKEMQRERAFEYFIKHHIGMKEANEELIKHDFLPLGNANN